jgi:ATP synthase protein I
MLQTQYPRPVAKSTAECRFLDSLLGGQYGPPAFARQGRSAVVAGVEWMSNDAREENERAEPPPAEDDFNARLRRARKRHSEDISENRSQVGADASALARGFRLSTELVAGVLLGGAIGWLLDRWLGISPWGMIVFLLLGFAAGVLNVMRAAGILPPRRMPPPSS